MTLRSFLKAFTRDRKGAQAVEFAIIAPVLLGFLFSTFELGRFMYDQSKVAAAAADGARAVALYGSADVTNVTNTVNARFTTAQRTRLATSVTNETFGTQTFRKVVVTYNFNFLIKFGHRYNGFTITATRYAPTF